mmetsp:Transcript_35528/g.100997  ORF Transcript_35528/g.100997 Transcript_35528/m.100997 type:complete len:510 (+) Transcript_35528:408-1937(+)
MLLAADATRAARDGGRRDREVVLEGEGLGALEAIQGLRNVQQLGVVDLHECQAVNVVLHVLRGRSRIVPIRKIRRSVRAVGSDVEIARHLVGVEIAMEATTLAFLLLPHSALRGVHAEHRHVEGAAEVEAVGLGVVFVLEAREPPRRALNRRRRHRRRRLRRRRRGLHGGLGRGRRGRRRGAVRGAAVGAGGEAIPSLPVVPAGADPALAHAVLEAVRPPLAGLDLLADLSAPVHAAGLELVGRRAVVVPASRLCPVLGQVNHESLSQVVTVHDDVVEHTSWPRLQLFLLLGVAPARARAVRVQDVFFVGVVVAAAVEVVVVLEEALEARAEVQRQRLQRSAAIRRGQRPQRLEREVPSERSAYSGLTPGAGQVSEPGELRQVVIRAVVVQSDDLRRLIRRPRGAIVLALLDGLDSRQRPALEAIGVQHIGTSVAALAVRERPVAGEARLVSRVVCKLRRTSAARSSICRLGVILHERRIHNRAVLVEPLLEERRSDVHGARAHDVLIV